MTQLELAEIFSVTIDQLMQVKADTKEKTDEKSEPMKLSACWV